MGARSYVFVSVVMSIDGHIDDMHDVRLMLSSEEDFDRVDEVRTSVDAILVGANTIRRDNRRDSADRERRPAPLPNRTRPPMKGPTTDRDRERLKQAIELAEKCTPSRTAFSVGAVITDANGAVLATGYSRETDPRGHAEETVLAKLAPGDSRLHEATLYSSLEPCSTRASRPRSCTELILATPISRIVFAWHEPDLFVDCKGAELLRAAGREVVEVPKLAHLVRRTNQHLLKL
ncbi:MAG: dihydrofolate reductase family protein [Actinomycetota bacterium]|nr:dihydrofolate reductase family protein [Actinomycetota bacterium]